MKARDVMDRHVVSVAPDETILEAGELMLRHHVSGLPVVDWNERLIGIVTERDFLRPIGSQMGDPRPRWFEVIAARPVISEPAVLRCRRKVAEVMTPNPVTVDDNTPVDEVVRIMETHRIKRLPVMRENRMVGIISRENLMHALLRSIHKSTALTKQNEAERGRLAELEREAWLHRTRT